MTGTKAIITLCSAVSIVLLHAGNGRAATREA